MDIQIFDNGGKTNGRYWLIFDNTKVYALTADPFATGGARYLCAALDLDRKEVGRRIELIDLPQAVRKAIVINWFGKEAA